LAAYAFRLWFPKSRSYGPIGGGYAPNPPGDGNTDGPPGGGVNKPNLT